MSWWIWIKVIFTCTKQPKSMAVKWTNLAVFSFFSLLERSLLRLASSSSSFFRFIIKDRETFFTPSQRSQIVWEILLRVRYNNSDQGRGYEQFRKSSFVQLFIYSFIYLSINVFIYSLQMKLDRIVVSFFKGGCLSLMQS